MERSSFYLVLEIDTREKRRTSLEDLLLTEKWWWNASHISSSGFPMAICGKWDSETSNTFLRDTQPERSESESQSSGSMLYLLHLFRTAHTYQLVTRRHTKGLVKTSVAQKVSALLAPPHTPCKIGAWISNHLGVYPEKISHLGAYERKRKKLGERRKEESRAFNWLFAHLCMLSLANNWALAVFDHPGRISQ